MTLTQEILLLLFKYRNSRYSITWRRLSRWKKFAPSSIYNTTNILRRQNLIKKNGERLIIADLGIKKLEDDRLISSLEKLLC